MPRVKYSFVFSQYQINNHPSVQQQLFIFVNNQPYLWEPNIYEGNIKELGIIYEHLISAPGSWSSPLGIPQIGQQ